MYRGGQLAKFMGEKKVKPFPHSKMSCTKKWKRNLDRNARGRPGAAGGGRGRLVMPGGSRGQTGAAGAASNTRGISETFMFGLVSRCQNEESGLSTIVSFRQESSPRALFEKY